jgi:hypothetical protein
MAVKARPIDKLRKRLHREWLLVAVGRVDPRTQAPLTGRLLAHSPHRDEIYRRSVKAKGPAFVVYSDKTLPRGYAAAFRA